MKSENPAHRAPGWTQRFLTAIEWVGNLLPHPVTLFAIFAVGVVVLSGIAAGFEWSVPHPEKPGEVIAAVSLMNGEGVRKIVTNLVKNFVEFVPLGTVLVALLGVGVAEKSGLLSAAIRLIILGAPKTFVTMALVLAGVLSNTASEMGYVVIVPMGAAIFYSLGRHPLAGLAAAFAGVSGGYSANLLLGTIDPLLAGITQEAARAVQPGYEVHPAVNWYFMMISVPLITLMGTWVTAKIVEPRLGNFDPSGAEPGIENIIVVASLSKRERTALIWAGVASLLTLALFVYFAGPFQQKLDGIPGYGMLRDPQTGALLNAPFTRGIVAMIFLFFLVPGFVYGYVVGSMRNDRDVINAMSGAMSSMGLYIVLVFFAAQFVKYFEWSNFGAIIAVLGADAIVAMKLDNALVFVPFIVMCALLNLVIGSASAKWAVTAPIFVPMLMRVGYSPEVIQTAYRVGDSTTNIVTPMMSYFGIIYAFASRYDRRLGIGTLISIMMPHAIVFLVSWTLLFYLWVFVFGLPVGPGAPTYFTPAPAD